MVRWKSTCKGGGCEGAFLGLTVTVSDLGLVEGGGTAQPNIVLILANDVGNSKLGSCGHGKIRRPLSLR